MRGLSQPAPVRRLSRTWALGAIAALAAWQVGLGPPGPGLDSSWNAGLAMAVHGGLQFGREIVFTYGPLGFLQSRAVWFQGLSALALLYSAAVYVAFSVALVWALRRRLGPLPSLLVAFLALAVLPLLELALLLAVIACVWLLERERPARATWLFVLAAGSFAAVEVLVKLSIGPVIAAAFLLALLGARAAWPRLLAYLALLIAGAALLWLATGQSLGAVPAFLENTLQIVSGYSTAMIRHTEVAAWKVTAATLAAAAVAIALALVAWRAGYRDRRARWAGTAIAALTAFAVFKEGVVRTDAGHLSLFFSNACVLWLVLGLGQARWRWMLAAAAAVAVMGLPVRPSGTPTNLDVFSNLGDAVDQVRLLLSPGRRERLSEEGRAGMRATYQLEPAMLAALRGRTVAVEPWEAAAVWAYRLRWRPLPVFQNYSAYTSALDRLNAEAVASPDGPERILRENQLLVYKEFPTLDLDGRFWGWDPPEQARAVLCNFAPLQTSERWQVLGRTPNRCGRPRLLREVHAAAGETVPVPAAGPGQVVFVRIGGAGVSGLERVSTFLLHAATRHLVVNGETSYRLIPETAGDGLLLRGGAGIEESGPFSPIPGAKTIAVDGAPGGLAFSFYRMGVRPVPPG